MHLSSAELKVGTPRHWRRCGTLKMTTFIKDLIACVSCPYLYPSFHLIPAFLTRLLHNLISIIFKLLHHSIETSENTVKTLYLNTHRVKPRSHRFSMPLSQLDVVSLHSLEKHRITLPFC